MPFQPPTPQHSRLSRLVRRQPLSVFFGATFAASWALWTPLVVARDELPGALGLVLRILGTAVPSVLALLFLAATFGKTGVRTILGRLLMWRVGTRWYVAVLGLSALLAVAVGVSVLFGGNAPTAAPAVSVVL